MTRQFLKKQCQELNHELNELNKKSNAISIIRFILSIGVIVDLLVGYFQNKPVLYILSIICLIGFMVLVVIHQNIKNMIQYKTSLRDVYSEHLLRMEDKWDQFIDDGSAFIDEKDYSSLDLDVFGHHSLYQMINIAFTKKGKEQLANDLRHKTSDKNLLIFKQQAIEELFNHSEFVVKMQTYGRLIHNHKETIISNFMNSTTHCHYRIIPMLFIALPIILLISLGCHLLSIGTPITTVIVEVVVLIQICLGFAFILQHNQMLEPVSKLSKSLKSYLFVFELIKNENFESPLLKQYQKDIIYEHKAIEGIKKLSIISDRATYRQNIFAFIFLNGLGLYDFWLRNSYISWLNTYQSSIEQWFSNLAYIESLMSLSVFKIDGFDVTTPIIKDNITLSFQNMRHPLIPQDKVVGNDFKIKNNVCIITGSNMSGKTTFMRTIGLNLILAYAGGYVFGNDFHCSIMTMKTSMRVKDNVEEGISTFYGELLRIKDMVEYAALNKPFICFVDEIFKGTNSLDRIAGAKATIKKLSLNHGITFLTTHDFELCEIEDILYDNYHFDEYYQDNKINFDYHIKAGKSQSTNGQFLLKQLGIME